MKVKNYMEDVIDQFLPKVLKGYPSLCQCSLCSSDIKALALNYLPPRYVATDLGEIYTKANGLSSQFEADALKSIVQAIQVVSQQPRHQ